jgi:hypothetical protein
VGEAGGQFSEGGEFFALLLLAGDVPDAVCQQSNEPLGNLGHALKKFGKLSSGKRQDATGKYSTHSHTDRFHSGKGENACDFPGTGSENRAILWAALAPGPEFALQHHQHSVRGSPLFDDDSTNFDAALFRLCDEPFQISFRLIRERRHGPQAGDQGFHSGWIQSFAH